MIMFLTIDMKKFTSHTIILSLLITFILFVPKPTDCSLSPHDSQDLLVTLKGLHQTLSKLVDHLSTGTHDGKHSRNGGGSGGGGGSGSSSGRSGGGSSSLGSLSPPSGNGLSRNGGRTSGSNDVRKSSGSGSSSLGSIGGDYPSQDKSSDSGGPVRKNPGQRPFQCAPGYAGSYTRSIHSPEAGISYTSNMLEARWDVETGWAPAFIVPIGNFSLNPSTKALMYGQMVFDSIRANMGYDNRIRLLRPRNHLANLRKAATRMALPDFDDEELLICMKRLVLSDASLIPAPYTNASLEIRVALMGSDSKIEIEPSKSAILYVYMVPHTQVSLLQYTEPRTVYVDPQYARSWPGSLGEYKTSNNYASTMLPTHTAHELGFNDVMYVYGKEEYITGLNDANVFAFIINDLGAQELITPPADGLIVPDVTRKTVLEMARHWGEFLVTERPISIHEIRTLHRQGRLLEMFASNTMANTVPIVSIYYAPKRDIIRVVTLGRQGSLSNRFNRAFQSIENGLVDHPWGLVI